MQLRPQNERILFGLKLRQLRQRRELSFQQLSKLTGISVSYLNEIERGKKSPKKDKLKDLAATLDVEVATLEDPTLDAAMMPVVDLLRSNFLNELPLDRFGIELSKIVEIIGSAPARVGAFISTLLQLSRNYALLDENFYEGALRSWLEMHENYLEDSEAFAKTLREELKWEPAYVPTAEELGYILRYKYDYRIEKGGLDQHEAFEGLERVFLPTDRSLLLAGSMEERDLRHHLAKEIGYQILQLSKERSLTSPIVEMSGFDMALAQARAHAFASALLLPAEQFDAELKGFFGEGELEPDIFQQLLKRYKVTPLLLLDRVAALLPQFREIRSLFLIQLTESDPGELSVTRELHLGKHHRPHATGLREHYCRRWVGVRTLFGGRHTAQVGLQVSRFHGSDEEYLVLAISDRQHNGKRQSTFLGMPLTPELEGTIPALVKAALQHQVVSNTCERCPIENCNERAAPPNAANLKQQRKQVGETIDDLQRKARQAARSYRS
ncbi:MAG: helix-turn-helix domain-containing protein [Saprospiraceae bacterium]